MRKKKIQISTRAKMTIDMVNKIKPTKHSKTLIK